MSVTRLLQLPKAVNLNLNSLRENSCSILCEFAFSSLFHRNEPQCCYDIAMIVLDSSATLTQVKLISVIPRMREESELVTIMSISQKEWLLKFSYFFLLLPLFKHFEARRLWFVWLVTGIGVVVIIIWAHHQKQVVCRNRCASKQLAHLFLTTKESQ